jgi:hypothetical protein
MNEIKQMTEEEIEKWYMPREVKFLTLIHLIDFARHTGILKEEEPKCEHGSMVYDKDGVGHRFKWAAKYCPECGVKL